MIGGSGRPAARRAAHGRLGIVVSPSSDLTLTFVAEDPDRWAEIGHYWARNCLQPCATPRLADGLFSRFVPRAYSRSVEARFVEDTGSLVSPPVLRARGLHKSYGRHQILAGIDITLRAGEIVALVGENGAGKSTLVHCLAGMQPTDSGTVDLRADSLAVVWQDLSLCENLDVVANLFLGREIHRVMLSEDAMLGALVIGAIRNGMTLLIVSSDVRFIVTGVVLLIVATIDAVSRRGRASAGRA
jgi:hypothetical protein